MRETPSGRQPTGSNSAHTVRTAVGTSARPGHSVVSVDNDEYEYSEPCQQFREHRGGHSQSERISLCPKILPLAFSTGGGYCAEDFYEVFEDLARRRAGESTETPTEAEKEALFARETGRLRRELSITHQDAVS